MANCAKCESKCISCATTANNCTACRGDRTGSDCTCAVGFYDDGVSEFCKPCVYNCSKCNGGTIDSCNIC